MSGLPWIRLDSNWASHDKILTLAEGKQWQAITAFVASIAWSGGHGTSGLIPRLALPWIHATPRIAAQLVDVRLWERIPEGGTDGWIIRNWDRYQAELDEYWTWRNSRSDLGRLGGCKKNHTQPCTLSACVSARERLARSNGNGPG